MGILGYALAAFDITVPAAVDVEIRAPDAMYPSRVYPDTALFLQLRARLRDAPTPEPEPLQLFGPGEAAAISLAAATEGAVLLINDRRPASYARNLGIAVVTVPATIVIARAEELIPDHVARALLGAAGRHGTSTEVVATATAVLDRL